MKNPFKWNRIGYVEGVIRFDDNRSLKVKSIMFVREPFLWFKTRKVVEIGERNVMRYNNFSSESVRAHDRAVKDWLLGGKINYVSENGSNKPAEIIKLVKK